MIEKSSFKRNYVSIPSFITTNKFKNILPNTTDKIKSSQVTRTKLKTKTNLTSMKLTVKLCDRKCIGQIRRILKIRFNEHSSLIKFDREDKFAVANIA